MTYKVLCICDGGNVRSVAMAQYIKELNGKWELRKEGFELKYEAIAIGDKEITKETEELLKKHWADEVIDVRKFIPEDLWHNSRHPELKEKVKEIWKKLH